MSTKSPRDTKVARKMNPKDTKDRELNIHNSPLALHDSPVATALELYLEEIGKSRAGSTLNTYYYTIEKFKGTLARRGCPPDKTPLAEMTNEWIQWFLDDLRTLEPTTERSYLAAVIGFYEYVVAKNWLDLNLTEMRYFVRRRQRKLPQRARRFPKNQIEKLLHAMDCLVDAGTFENDRERITALRDRALFYLLADTGLRVSEACSLTVGQVDFDEFELFAVGKGSKEARIRISPRALARLQNYLNIREILHDTPPSPAAAPLFARHDRRAGKQLRPISSRAVQQVVDRRVGQILGQQHLYKITPHSFRHYFVTTVLRATGGDVEVAKKLARHADISTTMRYAHLSDEELDRKYYEIFEE